MVKNQNLEWRTLQRSGSSSEHCLSVFCLDILYTARVGFQTTLWATQLPKATHTQPPAHEQKYSVPAEDSEERNKVLGTVGGEVHMSVYKLFSLASRQ